MAVRIDPGLCPQNHRCPMIDVCPVEAISQEGFALPTVDPERCISCGQCVAGCGKGAMSLADEDAPARSGSAGAARAVLYDSSAVTKHYRMKQRPTSKVGRCSLW